MNPAAKTAVVALVLLGGLIGCVAEESDHPPVLTTGGTGPENPVVCDSLADPQRPPEVDGAGVIRVDGRAAGCVAEGQQCPLWSAVEWCDAGFAVAECFGNQWRTTCWASADAAAPGSDAGDSATDGPGDGE